MIKTELVKIHLLFTGHVQNVGFRHFVKSSAKKLNISGWVRNLSSGQVEIVAVGKNQQISQFVNKIQTGTILSEIEKTSILSKEVISIDPFDSKFEKRETI